MVYTIQIATPAVIKISILLLYLRLFSSSRKLRIATYILIGVVASYMIAFELSLIFGCRPVRKLVTPELRGTCFDIQRHALAQAAVNVATDLLVLFLPIPIVIRLHAPRRQKVALMVMFSLASMYVERGTYNTLRGAPPLLTQLTLCEQVLHRQRHAHRLHHLLPSAEQ